MAEHSGAGLPDALRRLQARLRTLPLNAGFRAARLDEEIAAARKVFDETKDLDKATKAITDDLGWAGECNAIDADLREAARIAQSLGLSGAGCLILAESLHRGELQHLVAPACAELELLALATARELERAALPRDAEATRKQKGIDAWNGGETWREVAELLGCDGDDWRAVKEEIRRFARATNQQLRKGKPGSPRLTGKKE